MQVARALLIAGLLAWAWAGLTTLAAFLLVLWGVEQIKHGRVRVVWSPLLAPSILFFAVGVIQFHANLTLDRMATREAALKLATDLLLFFLAAQFFARAPKSMWRGFVAAVTIFAFALALLAILQYFSGGGLIYWTIKTASRCAFGPYANHNHYAGLMEMLIPIAVAGVLSRRGPSSFGAFFGFAIVVALASVLLSGSRGSFIALVAEMVILGAILAWVPPPKPLRSRWVMVPLGVAASAALFFLIDPGEVSQRLASVADIPLKPAATLAERRLVSRDALRIFVDHPWMGVGLGSFETAYPRYQSFATDLLWDHAHNDYAQALAETGLVGGVLIAAALSTFLPLAFSRLRERLKHEVGWIQIGAAVGCCGLLVHSFGDFNFHIPANAAWFAVCAAIATQSEISARSADAAVNERLLRA